MRPPSLFQVSGIGEHLDNGQVEDGEMSAPELHRSEAQRSHLQSSLSFEILIYSQVGLFLVPFSEG